MRTMRKLSADEDTVKIYVPVPRSTRDKFKRAIGKRKMADVIREDIEARIETIPKPKKRAGAEREPA